MATEALQLNEAVMSFEREFGDKINVVRSVVVFKVMSSEANLQLCPQPPLQRISSRVQQGAHVMVGNEKGQVC